jgi:hypothetical protein
MDGISIVSSISLVLLVMHGFDVLQSGAPSM